LSGKSAATGINLLLEKGAEGIFNVGGGTAISRYEFAVLASRSLNLPEATIISKSQMEVESKAFRPANLTMNLEKIKGLGFVPDYKIEHLSH
jgi:dTDP-4-dehydrorhamnose reductase